MFLLISVPARKALMFNLIISSPFFSKMADIASSISSSGKDKNGRAAPNKTIFAVRAEPTSFAISSILIKI